MDVPGDVLICDVPAESAEEDGEDEGGGGGAQDGNDESSQTIDRDPDGVDEDEVIDKDAGDEEDNGDDDGTKPRSVLTSSRTKDQAKDKVLAFNETATIRFFGLTSPTENQRPSFEEQLGGKWRTRAMPPYRWFLDEEHDENGKSPSFKETYPKYKRLQSICNDLIREGDKDWYQAYLYLRPIARLLGSYTEFTWNLPHDEIASAPFSACIRAVSDGLPQRRLEDARKLVEKGLLDEGDFDFLAELFGDATDADAGEAPATATNDDDDDLSNVWYTLDEVEALAGRLAEVVYKVDKVPQLKAEKPRFVLQANAKALYRWIAQAKKSQPKSSFEELLEARHRVFKEGIFNPAEVEWWRDGGYIDGDDVAVLAAIFPTSPASAGADSENHDGEDEVGPTLEPLTLPLRPATPASTNTFRAPSSSPSTIDEEGNTEIRTEMNDNDGEEDAQNPDKSSKERSSTPSTEDEEGDTRMDDRRDEGNENNETQKTKDPAEAEAREAAVSAKCQRITRLAARLKRVEKLSGDPAVWALGDLSRQLRAHHLEGREGGGGGGSDASFTAWLARDAEETGRRVLKARDVERWREMRLLFDAREVAFLKGLIGDGGGDTEGLDAEDGDAEDDEQRINSEQDGDEQVEDTDEELFGSKKGCSCCVLNVESN
jgi:hypothetical protein